MPKYESSPDMYWSSEGDFVVDSETGDIATTKNKRYRSFIQRILTRVKAKSGDWPLQNQLGAGITGFVGQPNTAATGQRMKESIESELTRDGFIAPGHLQVKVVPVKSNMVAILISINPPDTRGEILLTFTYDLRDNRLVPRNV